MKTMVKILLTLLFASIFFGCDNTYKDINTGDGVMFYGSDDNNGKFYGFIEGGKYYIEDTEESKCNWLYKVISNGKDVYSLTMEIFKDEQGLYQDTTWVIRKNGKLMARDLFDGYLCFINGKVRLYTVNRFLTFDPYTPQYWEDGVIYDVDLEAPSFESMTIYPYIQSVKEYKGDLYYMGFLRAANGKTQCMWKNSKLLFHNDPTLNSNTTAKGFVFENNDVIMLTQYVTSINDINNPHCLAATYRNGKLEHIIGDTALFKTNRGYNVYPIGIGQNGDDIYIGVLEKKGDYIFGDLVLYKNYQEIFRKDLTMNFTCFLLAGEDIYIVYEPYIDSNQIIFTFLKNGKEVRSLMGQPRDGLHFQGIVDTHK